MKRALACALFFVACSAETAPSSDRTCEPDPELGASLSPRAVRLGGWDANGVALNGVSRGGWDGNGAMLDGVDFSAVVGAANELVAKNPDGSVVGGETFVGSKLKGVRRDGSTLDLVISSFDRSADGTIAYYGLEHARDNVCNEGMRGMFVRGVWDERGAWHDSVSVSGGSVSMSYSCADGAIAKCIEMGYAPWSAGHDLHQACTRMVRADYCGSGISFTKDGTLIDVFDTRGIQTRTGSSDFVFEAAWGVDGATCVNRPRFDARDGRGESIMPSCWSLLPSCGSLGEAHGAILANASRVQSRTFCR
jgi:hypothetical protein